MKVHPVLFTMVCCMVGSVSAAAQLPDKLADKTLVVLLNAAQLCRAELHGEAKGPWYPMMFDTPLLMRFPAGGGNAYTTAHPHNNEENHWPDISVSYEAVDGGKAAYVKFGNNDFNVLVELTSPVQTVPAGGTVPVTEGKAYMYWHEDGETRHIRSATFILRDAWKYDPSFQLPAASQEDGDPDLLDDGLNDILTALQNRTVRNADERLYIRRLTSLLPTVMTLRDPNFTSDEYKGNTALHYAAGLGHKELVQWLVDHGADTTARTAKGKTPMQCVGRENAAAIRKILSSGQPSEVMAPASLVKRTFTYSSESLDEPIVVSWKKSDVEDEGKVTPDKDWLITHVEYSRTGQATATVQRRTEWAPGGTYAAGWRDMVFELKFTSPKGGTATCTETDKTGTENVTEGTFTIN